MSSQEKCILIVGAGPVGLSLALMLKQMDVPFRIIEKRKEESNYSRAFAIQSRTLEIFKQLEVLDDIKSRGRYNVSSNNVYNNGSFSYCIALPPSESSEPFAAGLKQSKTEEVLINELNELGVDIERGAELQKMHKEGHIVEYVEVKNSEGDKEMIYTDTLIGCDGGRSKVRELSGIRFIGENELLRITCMDVRVKSELSGGNFTRYAEHQYLGNVYLCGDAAHIHSPAGGLGMNTGIQDAYDLAWQLSYIHKCIGDPKVLGNNFHEERSAVAKMVLKDSSKMNRNIFSPIGPLKSFIIHKIFPIMMSFSFFIQKNANNLAQVLIKYEHNDRIKDTDAGRLYNSKIPGVGFRIPPYELFELELNRVRNVHGILNGAHCFEIFLHIPNSFLELKNLDKLRSTINLSSTSPTLLHFKHKSKNSQPFYQLNLIITSNMFQPDQWARQLNHSSADDVKYLFQSTKTYLDLNQQSSKYLKFSKKRISMFIVRPDAVVGLVTPTTPERCQHEIESYFQRFIVS